MSLLSGIFPPVCAGCGEEFSGIPGTLCPACLAKLHVFDHHFRCPGCGGENLSPAALCAECSQEPPRPWKNALALFAYCSYGKKLIRKLKFGNAVGLARPLGSMAAELFRNSGYHADVIVPIPLTPLRIISRTYNQSDLIAKVVSENCGIPRAALLKRKFSLRHQAFLNRKQRHSGLKDVFKLNPFCREPVLGKSILLIDDVLTTGATLSAAAGVLIDAGAADICIMVIARSVSPAIFGPENFFH